MSVNTKEFGKFALSNFTELYATAIEQHDNERNAIKSTLEILLTKFSAETGNKLTNATIQTYASAFFLRF